MSLQLDKRKRIAEDAGTLINCSTIQQMIRAVYVHITPNNTGSTTEFERGGEVGGRELKRELSSAY